MKRFAFALLGLAAASAAHAANQYSSERPFSPATVAECSATNVGGSTITATVDILDGTGASVASSGSVSIASGTSAGAVLTTTTASIRCAITTSASTGNVRGAMVIYDSGLLIQDSAETR